MNTILVVGDEQIATACDDALDGQCAVEAVPTLQGAIERLASLNSAVLITELVLQDGDGTALCEAARARSGVLALAVTSDPERVPRALAAGCHSVLLKPFARNLLFARLGRLTRDLGVKAAANGSGGTNEYWPDLHCPQCARGGVTSFDATGLHRLWFACGSCHHVWVGRRPRPARRLQAIA